MLTYLTKYSSPDISNAVRELTKYMHKSTPMPYKEMLRVVNFVLDTRDLGLKLQPVIQQGKDEWDFVGVYRFRLGWQQGFKEALYWLYPVPDGIPSSMEKQATIFCQSLQC